MALPSEKLRAYRPLLDVLVAELLREFDQELQQFPAGQVDGRAECLVRAEIAPPPADE